MLSIAIKIIMLVNALAVSFQVEDISLQLIEKEEVIKQFEVRNKVS